MLVSITNARPSYEGTHAIQPVCRLSDRDVPDASPSRGPKEIRHEYNQAY